MILSRGFTPHTCSSQDFCRKGDPHQFHQTLVKYGDFQLGEIRYVGLGGETEIQIAPVVGRPDHRVDPYVSKMEVKGSVSENNNGGPDAWLTIWHPHSKPSRTVHKVPGYSPLQITQK